MLNTDLKDFLVANVLPNVTTPAQYLGGERNSVRKDHRECRGTLCLAFPDTYSLGMSHHGLAGALQPDERPGMGLRAILHTPARLRGRAPRPHAGPAVFGLETFTPLGKFDVLGFSLQYEISYSRTS